ncbi:MAG: GNAT family N-acetyltransferase [Candidatus Paceibacterota bacterium]
MKLITQANASLLFEVRKAVDGPFTPSQADKVRKETRKYARGGDRAAYVICDGETAIGYIECKLAEDLPAGCPQSDEFRDVGHMARIGVLKEHRIRGLGRQLMGQAEAWLRIRRRKGAWLDYRHQNWDLTVFYARVGYRDTMEITDPVKGGMREIAVKRW